MKEDMHLTLPFPPSVNSLYSTDWKTKRRFKSKKYAEWSLEASKCYHSGIGYRFYNLVSVSYVFGRPDKRTRDLANYIKAVDDFIVEAKFIKDDSQIHEIHAKWGDVKGVELTITEL